MDIRIINNKQEWEDFLMRCPRKTFLQSWYWGEFHKSLGNSIWRFGIYEGATMVAAALTIKIAARRGSFLLVPHGPVGDKKTLPRLLEKLKELAKIEKVDFIRISPIMERTPENEKIFRDLHFRPGPLHYHPESSWKLDISPSEEELLKGMRKSTRYLIKKALENKDIEIVKSQDIDDIKLFYKLHTPVAKIQKFVPFSEKYLQKEFSAFLKDNNISLYFAKYKGEYIATAFEIFWSGIGFYHHAALLPQYHNVPVSAFLQWEAIKEAKARGCRTYDFWGYADPLKNPKHPYAGPTLFKQGFGGYVDTYVKTQDFAISPRYWINYVIELARKIKRGL